MNTGFHRPTATIYAFPAGGRAALGGFRSLGSIAPSLPHAVPAIAGGGWYHDAAIQEEADRVRKSRGR